MLAGIGLPPPAPASHPGSPVQGGCHHTRQRRAGRMSASKLFSLRKESALFCKGSLMVSATGAEPLVDRQVLVDGNVTLKLLADVIIASLAACPPTVVAQQSLQPLGKIIPAGVVAKLGRKSIRVNGTENGAAVGGGFQKC